MRSGKILPLRAGCFAVDSVILISWIYGCCLNLILGEDKGDRFYFQRSLLNPTVARCCFFSQYF
nr:hypothetical protein [Nostoc sp. EkiNYC01]